MESTDDVKPLNELNHQKNVNYHNHVEAETNKNASASKLS